MIKAASLSLVSPSDHLSVCSNQIIGGRRPRPSWPDAPRRQCGIPVVTDRDAWRVLGEMSSSRLNVGWMMKKINGSSGSTASQELENPWSPKRSPRWASRAGNLGWVSFVRVTLMIGATSAPSSLHSPSSSLTTIHASARSCYRSWLRAPALEKKPFALEWRNSLSAHSGQHKLIRSSSSMCSMSAKTRSRHPHFSLCSLVVWTISPLLNSSSLADLNPGFAPDSD